MQRSRESKKIWLSTPTMHGNEMQYIQEAFDKNWVAPLGFNVDSFEAEAAEYLGENVHTLALNAGTAALHLAVKLAGVKRGDVVLCTDMTFAATVNPVTYEGAKPVFVDAERETWNMDPAALEAAFEKYPEAKVVMLAHLYGTPAKMDEIVSICEKHGAILIEDAAEAFAAEYKEKKMGTFGKHAVLSFNGNKIITTSGGGMLVTDTEEAKKKAFFWATQARDAAPWYQHSEIGYNYRMSNVVAGIGRGQMKFLDEHRDIKEKIYRRYEAGFKGLPVKMNPYLECSKPNFWLSCLTIDEEAMEVCNPEKMRLALEELNIETRPIWKPMHMQPVFADCDMITVGDNVGEDIFARGLCLPS
ncbi:MAG: aminotransferase class I/II-fold pyridoxal phosphate-dependent enzyme, partial [Clostridia bacterium]|nr:aminotransferase class I/II-fold pyridoxal phosphate-dependent enzyme [Clostridia bacterium]